jgi:xanthine dehydrogenase/oxidase
MDQLHWFAGTQIRNVASIGGNVVNASPISDLNPVWMACGAQFKVQSAKGERMVPAETFFGKGYKQIDLKADEVLVSVGMYCSQFFLSFF